MSFIHSPQRIWLDIAVGIVLSSMLVFGSIGIYRLSNDARERELNSALAQRGQELSTGLGCVACHTVDGSPGVGPSWQGMWGRTETLTNGNTIVVDEAYFRESLIEPPRKMVAGYPNVMLRYFLEEEEIIALMEFAKQLTPPQQQ
ncbi:MAG: c-type cytochrome [Gammaproteobacteria bacterium]